MVTKKSIEDFLKFRTFALVGVSRNQSNFGSIVYRELLNKGFSIFPVNHKAETIEGDKAFKRISDLPPEVDKLVVITNKKHTLEVVLEAVNHGVKDIWINRNSETPEIIEICQYHEVNLIYDECILMHCQPVNGVHAFHRFFNKVFGQLPK